jgi:hypothetical protein
MVVELELIILREKYKPRIFEDRKIFGPKRDEVTG